MRAKRKSKFKKQKIKAAAVLLIIFSLFLLINCSVKSKIKDLAITKSRNNAERIIDDAITYTINDDRITYDSLVEITQNSESGISSVECNSAQVNLLKSDIIKNINDSFSNDENCSFDVSLGTVSGINLLSGKGPDITVNFERAGSVNAHIVSSFTDAGLNQTLHRIIIKIDVDISAVTSAGTFESEISTEYLAAETVIVGEIPQRYAVIS